MSSILSDECLGLMYINESFSGDNVISNIDTKRTADLFYVTFDTNLQDFDVENRNKRYYDAKNIWDCIQTEKIQYLLKTGGWFGEFEHPAPEIAGEKLSPERIQNVPPEKRAFKIMAPHIQGNVLKARIQSAQGAVGEGFGKEILAGWQPQFSARAIATMMMRNNKPYVMVRRLITYDAPWFPSHRCAHATSGATVTTRSFKESAVTEHVNTAEDNINGVMIPLTEILKDIGRSDVNTQMIMESFDLSDDALIGFNATHNKIILKDENNIIYSNINPESVKRVNDFYTSF